MPTELDIRIDATEMTCVLLEMTQKLHQDKITPEQIIHWFTSLDIAERERLTGICRAVSHCRFVFVDSCVIQVPQEYRHETAVANYQKRNPKMFFDPSFSDSGNITDEHFNKASIKLDPGKLLHVEIFQVKQEEVVHSLQTFLRGLRPVTSEDCLTFLKSREALLAGAQGLVLALEQCPRVFTDWIHYLSLDNANALWKSEFGIKIPATRRMNTGLQLDLIRFDHSQEGKYILCFRDLK